MTCFSNLSIPSKSISLPWLHPTNIQWMLAWSPRDVETVRMGETGPQTFLQNPWLNPTQQGVRSQGLPKALKSLHSLTQCCKKKTIV